MVQAAARCARKGGKDDIAALQRHLMRQQRAARHQYRSWQDICRLHSTRQTVPTPAVLSSCTRESPPSLLSSAASFTVHSIESAHPTSQQEQQRHTYRGALRLEVPHRALRLDDGNFSRNDQGSPNDHRVTILSSGKVEVSRTRARHEQRRTSITACTPSSPTVQPHEDARDQNIKVSKLITAREIYSSSEVKILGPVEVAIICL